MKIHQLSANIDHKVAQLNQQIAQLNQQATQGEPGNLQQEIATLERMRTKLTRSRDLMWQAHELERKSDKKRLQRLNWLGIALCMISGLGLAAIAVTLLRH